jgi:hypothetical protein
MKTLLFIPFLFICSIALGQRTTLSEVIGKPIKIGNIEVSQYHYEVDRGFRSPTFAEAQAGCAALGNGWRLPTIKELELMDVNKAKIPQLMDFLNDAYWSSTVGDNHEYGQTMRAWKFHKNTRGAVNRSIEETECWVRPVRTIKK